MEFLENVSIKGGLLYRFKSKQVAEELAAWMQGTVDREGDFYVCGGYPEHVHKPLRVTVGKTEGDEEWADVFPLLKGLEKLELWITGPFELKRLPPDLEELGIKYCRERGNLDWVGVMPLSLRRLSVYNATVSGRFSRLPKGLETLRLVGCDVSSRELGEIPSGLVELVVKNCNLDKLPKLPKDLRILDCSYNPLTVLESLPSELRDLDFSGTLVSDLVDCTPTKLYRIRCWETPMLPVSDNENGRDGYTWLWMNDKGEKKIMTVSRK